MIFLDKATVAGTRKREDGYLVADVRVARTGIQRYSGAEVGRPEVEFVDVYRPAEEVFSTDAMKSFAYIPITNDHPSTPVTAANWRDHSVGVTSGDIARDGEFMSIPLMVADEETIKQVEDGKREVSAGYKCKLVFEDGVTPDGKTYQAKQTTIRGNHVAVVGAGRAGHECRIGDDGKQQQTKDDGTMSGNLQAMIVDGIPLNVDATTAAILGKLQNQLDKLTSDMATMQTTHDAAMKEKDEELEKEREEKDAALAKVPDQATIDKMIGDRVKLLADAAKLAPTAKFEGLSDADVRRLALTAAFGADAIAKDAKDEYVAAVFDVRVADVTRSGSPTPTGSSDAFADALRGIGGGNGATPVVDERQSAFADMLAYSATGVDAVKKEAA